MSRPIVLSNGSLHVGLNIYGMVHDLYYPYVGLENHARANKMRHKIGVWVEDQFSWLDSGEWHIGMDYVHDAMISLTKAHNERLNITLEFEDCVDAEHPAFLRNVHVINGADREREIRLFMHQVFRIDNSLSGDTAQYLPGEPAILHYKGHTAFIISGRGQQGRPFDRFAVGVYAIEGKDGTFRDAEDGTLSGNAVEHGSVDSVIGYTLFLRAHDSARVNYWLTAGEDQRQALATHRMIRSESVIKRQVATHLHWENWLKPAAKFVEVLPVETGEAFRKSLLIIKSHIDDHGAIIASTDTTMLNYSRDAYAYCWPRDGAFVLWPLMRIGYHEELQKFLAFCRNGLQPDGFLMHKYQADGALGSSWHPYVYEGAPQPPIQEDETAIIVFLLGQYYQNTGHTDLIEEFYPSLIKPMAGFMVNYIDRHTKLPHASYDLWEEKFLTTTYTTAIVYGALNAAAQMAEIMHDPENAVRWQTVADDMKAAAQEKLYNKERKFFYKGFRGGRSPAYDETIDVSSFYGAFMFGLFDLHSEEVSTSYQTLRDTFHLSNDPCPLLPRYENDKYNTVDTAGLGNPWFVTTLWLSQYFMEIGLMDEAEKIISWVRSRMMASGVLSEQLNPYSNQFVSVAPLVWSQAEFLNSVIDFVAEPPNLQPKPKGQNHGSG